MSSLRWRPDWELPLLIKELNEQSARPRTYIIRFLYAATLFFAACTLFYGNFLSADDGSTGSMGRGRFMFERLVTFQFWCIYLVLPAISCGALTIEKERNTLGLLLITALRPWQIVLQKALGRIVPMLTFVLLSFPLMAVAYSFGGVTPDYLWSGTLLLVLTCVQVGALSIACSAYFPTTVEAFIANFLIFLALFFVFPLGWGPGLFELAEEYPFRETVACCFLLVMLTGGFLVAAWTQVENRAFVPPRNALLGVFKRLDGWFNNMNRVTGGVILVHDGDPLPKDEPVAWRETAKKSLGTFRYLFRVLVAIELPLLFICQILRLNVPGGASLDPISMFLFILWGLAAAMIVVHAASVISSERSRQTLDVLLTTPLTGRELFLQKLKGVRRLMGILLVPFLTVFLFETWWNQGSTFVWLYLPLELVVLAVYLPLIAWFALWIGLKVRSQIKAVLTGITLIGAWLIIPVVVGRICTDLLGHRPDGLVRHLLFLTPTYLIPAIESMGGLVMPPIGSPQYASAMPAWWTFAANLLLHGLALYGLRHWCLANADRLLGRLSDVPATAAEQPPEVNGEATIGQLAT